MGFFVGGTWVSREGVLEARRERQILCLSTANAHSGVHASHTFGFVPESLLPFVG